MNGQIQLIKSRALVVGSLAVVSAGVVALEARYVEGRAARQDALANLVAAQRQAVARPRVRDRGGIGPRHHRDHERLALHAHELVRLEALEHRLVYNVEMFFFVIPLFFSYANARNIVFKAISTRTHIIY